MLVFTVETSGRLLSWMFSRASANPPDAGILRFLGAEIQEMKITRVREHPLIQLLTGVHGLSGHVLVWLTRGDLARCSVVLPAWLGTGSSISSLLFLSVPHIHTQFWARWCPRHSFPHGDCAFLICCLYRRLSFQAPGLLPLPGCCCCCLCLQLRGQLEQPFWTPDQQAPRSIWKWSFSSLESQRTLYLFYSTFHKHFDTNLLYIFSVLVRM